MPSIPDVPFDPPSAGERLRFLSAEERIGWACETFGEGAVLLSSMQKTASVLMHMLHRLRLPNEILFVDTGYHFPETLRLRDEWMRRYGLKIITLYPARTPEQQEAHFGEKLHRTPDGQPECCRLRKEEPFLRHMRERGRSLVLTGLLRAEGGRRANLAPLSRDPRFGGWALHPLFDWEPAQVLDYLGRHGVPVHPLHAQGYPSIGCQPCTTPVAPGEDPRAGRWRHLREAGGAGRTYCGINYHDGSGI